MRILFWYLIEFTPYLFQIAQFLCEKKKKGARIVAICCEPRPFGLQQRWEKLFAPVIIRTDRNCLQIFVVIWFNLMEYRRGEISVDEMKSSSNRHNQVNFIQRHLAPLIITFIEQMKVTHTHRHHC